jgi:hypothetical protein
MFLLGVLSLFQLILIPGIILVNLFKIKTTGIIQSFLYWMGLSLYSNYLVVCILTWLKLYISPVIFSIFSLEIVYLAYLFIRNINFILSGKTVKDYYLIFKNYLSQLSLLHKIVFVFACIVILFFISLIPFNIGTSYYFIDALNHWTRWPVRWASNSFPPDAGHYPQLFPANLSLIYVFTGELGNQFFPKAIMPLFFIGNLLIFFDLAFVHKSLVNLTGLVIYGFILIIFYSVLFILEVNADIPVSFFGFLTFYTIKRNEHEGFNIKTMLLVIVFASSAALTKLAGTYILALAVLWVIYVFYKNSKSISSRLIIKTGSYLLLILFGSIFWYLVRPVSMIKGLDQSIYLLPGYTTRFLNAAKMLIFTLGLPFLLFLSITLVASFFNKETKYIVTLIIFPALIIWAFFFSADFRNLSFAVPFIAYASAYGVLVIYNKVVKNKNVVKTYFTPIPIFKNKITLSILVILFLSLTFIGAGTNTFFNFGMKLAYLFHEHMFGGYRLGYFTEIGYYKYVEYIISAFRLSCIVLLVLFILRNAKVKISYVLLSIILISLTAGFICLKKENISQMLIHDKEMVKIHNLYFKVYSFVNIPDQNNLIIANNMSFSQLIPPSTTQFLYLNNFYLGILNEPVRQYQRNYLLLEKDNLSKETLDYIAYNIAAKRIIVCFEDEEFVFLKIGCQ